MIRTTFAAALIAASAFGAQAAALLPDFALVAAAPAAQNAPVGWFTDRFEPNSFSNVGAYQGRNDVLGIGISTSDNLASRPAGLNSSFYNTQGRQHLISGGAGSSITADLFIEAGWREGTSGNVRSDMWGVMSDSVANVTAYPIIGFTNYGGVARYRVFDGDVAGGWVDIVNKPVNFGGWTSFEILFTGTAFDFLIDGASVYVDNTIGGTTGFKAAIMQAYNFGDPSIVPGANAADYVAHWSNAQTATVPEPGALALFGLAFAGLAVARRRKV